MAIAVRRSDYYYLTIKDEPGEGHRTLANLAGLGVNLLAFTAVPTGPLRTQFAVFPEDESLLVRAAKRAGVPLDGPHPALLAQGDDELGALAEVHRMLSESGIDVFASSGVTDGRGGFGYVIYVKPGTIDRAVEILSH